jgi:hypothetical protein
MRIVSLVLLIPVVIASVGLFSGADWLMRPTPGWSSLPLGNLATWLSLVCLALLVLHQAKAKGRNGLQRFSLVLLVLALAWAPLGYLASGNWRFSFSGDETWLDVGLGPGLQSWWAVSGGLAGLLLASTVIALVLRRKPDPALSEAP